MSDTKIMPGRGIDIIDAAARAVGRTPYSIDVMFGPIHYILQLTGEVNEATGRRIFATLGVAEPTLTGRYGHNLQIIAMRARVAALDAELKILITKLPPAPSLTEICSLVNNTAALVAGVDNAREAEESR